MRREIKRVHDLVDIAKCDTSFGKAIRDGVDGEVAGMFLSTEPLLGSGAINSPSMNNAAAESCPCEMRYSRSSRFGQCAFLKGMDFSKPLIPRTIIRAMLLFGGLGFAIPCL